MLLAGGAWLSLLSSLNVAVQTVVPSWVTGRALSVYMLVFYAGLAGGSALWGDVGEHLGVSRALLISASGWSSASPPPCASTSAPARG